MNTIFKYENWKPDYFITVDRRVYREFGKEIETKFKDIPKFIPTPRLSMWQGKNFYYFKHFQGALWPENNKSLWQEDFNEPIIYSNSMHIAIKLAYYMGAKTILIIGMEHREHKADRHFWGIDLGMSADTNNKDSRGWLKGYKILSNKLAENKVQLINISEDTFVSDEIIQTDSYKNWLPVKKKRKVKDG